VDIERAEHALVSDTDRVEMVLSSPDKGNFRACSSRGSHSFRRVESGYETTNTDGLDPLKHQDCIRLLGRDAEIRAPYPLAHENSYPYAHDRIAQLFDHPNAPDAFVVRTAAFHVHGNLGEHGSLASIQSRSTLVAGGAESEPTGSSIDICSQSISHQRSPNCLAAELTRTGSTSAPRTAR